MVVYRQTTHWCRICEPRTSGGHISWGNSDLSLQIVQGLSLNLHQIVHSGEYSNQGINVERSIDKACC